MSWRSVFISKPAKLSLRDNALFIKQECEISVPLEDIAVVVIDCREVVITAPLLTALAQFGATLIVCDEHFLPCGQLLPFSQHSRFLKMLSLQMALPSEIKSILWQKIIRQKIYHQSFVLKCAGQDTLSQKLLTLSLEVKPNDLDRCEAKSAALYFPALFGNGFSRGIDTPVNIRLNYGYSIMRSAVARILVAYGFLPTLGLWHKNELNAFNLCDDLMEIFRQVVDLEVYTQFISDSINDEFETPDKTQLVKLLNYEMIFQNKKHSVLSSIEQMVKSLSSVLHNQNPDFFRLPEISYANECQYE